MCFVSHDLPKFSLWSRGFLHIQSRITFVTRSKKGNATVRILLSSLTPIGSSSQQVW